MKCSKLLVVCVMIGSFQFACKPRQSSDTTIPEVSSKKTTQSKVPKNIVGDETGDDSPGELDDGQSGLDPNSPEGQAAVIAGLRDQIKTLEERIKNGDQLTNEDKAKMAKEIETLKAALAAAEAKQKEATDKLIAASRSSAPSASSASGKGPSGYPYCGSVHYGDTFTCDPKLPYLCSKSDPQYLNICQLADGSAATVSTNTGGGIGASGRPYCGQFYYGDPFTCESQTCGKANPNYSGECELTANSIWAKGN